MFSDNRYDCVQHHHINYTVVFEEIKCGRSFFCCIYFIDIAETQAFYAQGNETFEKRSISFKFKKGEKFNRRNTLSILRIKF